ncbi:MAG: hypothetical protein KF696_13305 [Planctomycetes bacterium]|nr:hypothetical protein [Planctomycetota bacterium]MCW8135535.1 hypothetical protein [Planctomycetota bacterium]
MKTRLNALLLCALIAGAFSLTGCGPNLSSLDATVATYAKAFQAKDHELMVQCHVKADQEKLRKQHEESKKKESTGKEKSWTATAKGSKKVGDFTVGTIELKEEGDEKGFDMEFVLVEEDGKWKVSEAKGEEYQKKKLEDLMKGDQKD